MLKVGGFLEIGAVTGEIVGGRWWEVVDGGERITVVGDSGGLCCFYHSKEIGMKFDNAPLISVGSLSYFFCDFNNQIYE